MGGRVPLGSVAREDGRYGMIRELAKELYRLQQEVDRLEGRLRDAPSAEKEEIEEEMRMLRSERDRFRKILEAKKESPSYRKPI